MKKQISFLYLLIVILLITNCQKEDKSIEVTNLIITNLTEGDAFERGSVVTIIVDIEDNIDVIISEVKIFIDNLEVSFLQNFPSNYDWNTGDEETGNHTVKIISTDNNGNSFSNEIVLRIYVLNNQPCPCSSTVTDYDGNTYNTIQIGNQCWMKENLKVIHYADGTPLVDGTGAENTQYDTITKYYFNYDDNESYVETYGRLYNWMASVNGYASEIDLNPSQIQGVCPAGWHMPSDSEWKELEMYLGMSYEEAKDREWRGTIEGGMLKESGTAHWESPNIAATNESGFSALSAGHRNLTGNYISLGKKGSFWTSTNHIAINNTQNPAFRLLHNNYSRTYRYRGFHGYLTYARSVRCVKNE